MARAWQRPSSEALSLQTFMIRPLRTKQRKSAGDSLPKWRAFSVRRTDMGWFTTNWGPNIALRSEVVHVVMQVTRCRAR